MTDIEIFILMCFVLGGMLGAMVAWRHFLEWLERVKTGAHRLPVPSTVAPGGGPAALPVPAAGQDTTGPMSHGQWWPLAVEQVVHLLIVGASQEGKSTCARALLHARAATDDLLVLDPHGKFNPWGVPVVGVGRDWIAIDTAFTALREELSRRYRPGEPVGRPLTIFIDEYPAIAANCPEARATFLSLAREGAKPRMRLVVLTQDANVETLGISGQGEVRKNFTRLLLGSFAVQAMSACAPQRWPAVLEHRGTRTMVDRSALPKIAAHPVAQAPMWEVSVPVPASLGGPAWADTADTGTPDTADTSRADAVPVDTSGIPQSRIDTIRKASEKGLTRKEIATLLGGNHNNAMRTIKQVLEQPEELDG